MNTKWVGIVLLAGMVSTLSLAARTANPSYLSNIDEKWIVGVDKYPQWELGVNGSTWQDWTAIINDKIIADEGYNNLYDQRDASLFGPFAYIFSDYYNEDGYLDTAVSIQIPNTASTGKTIWFEVVYHGLNTYTQLDGNVSIMGNVDPIYEYDRKQNDDPADQWRILTLGWTVYPSPSIEWITFSAFGSGNQSPGVIKSISVDTLSHVVPAPGAVVLAGLGTAIVGYFRRKY